MKFTVTIEIVVCPSEIPMKLRGRDGTPAGNWVAYTHGERDNRNIGSGATAQAALQDLLTRLVMAMDDIEGPW